MDLKGPTRVSVLTPEADSGSRFFTSTEVEQLIISPLIDQAVATQVATVVRPGKNQLLEIPTIKAGDLALGPGWTAPGAEAPVVSSPQAESLIMEHYKIAGRADISWEVMDDAQYNVAQTYGTIIVSQIMAGIDRAYFDETDTAPWTGVGRLEGVNQLSAPTLQNTDVFLDAIEHAELHGTHVTSFVMSPQTKTAIAKLKKGTGSQENLLGVNEDPGTSTIAGVPLLSSRFVPEGVIWAIPQDRMFLSIRDDAEMVLDRTAKFEAMTASIIAYARIGAGCIEPEAVTKITLKTGK